MKRIGIYSGTFDPVHAGHVGFAMAAKRGCELDEVVLVPEPQPREKSHVTSMEHRTALITLAITQESGLAVRSLGQKRFTVRDTLPVLEVEYPGADITLLIGSDVAMGLPRWPDVQLLCQAVSFAIGLRATESREQVEQAMQQVAEVVGSEPRYRIITTDFSAHTSSAVRAAAPALPEIDTVRQYIQQHHLYADKHFEAAN